MIGIKKVEVRSDVAELYVVLRETRIGGKADSAVLGTVGQEEFDFVMGRPR